MAAFDGILSRVTEDGVGYLVDQKSKNVFPFTFDKILNYRGEAPSKLGLAAGAAVTYDLDGMGQIAKVTIKAQEKKKWFFFK